MEIGGRTVAGEQWIDTGLAISDTDVAEWSPLAWAQERIQYLIGLHRELHALWNISGERKWIDKTMQSIRVVVKQYTEVCELPAIEVDEAWFAPSTQLREGKKFLAGIEHKELEDWIAVWTQEAWRARAYVATLNHAHFAWRKGEGAAMGKEERKVFNSVLWRVEGHEVRRAEARRLAMQGIKDRTEAVKASHT
jgi:hypothetical protein